MTQIILNIESPSVAKAIKSLVKNISGVEIVTNRPRKKKSGYDLAMDDVRAGRVTEYNSVKELIAAAKK